MLTTTLNKSLADQIASFVCERSSSKAVCRSGTKERILIAFTNNLFQNEVLPNISHSLFFSFRRTVYELDQDTNSLQLDGFDVFTGLVTTLQVDVPSDTHSVNNAIGIINQNSKAGINYVVLGKIDGRFIIRLDGIGNNYGVTYWQGKLSQTGVGQPGAGGYGGGYVSGGYEGWLLREKRKGMKTSAPIQELTQVKTGVNVKSFLIPGVLIALLYFLG